MEWHPPTTGRHLLPPADLTGEIERLRRRVQQEADRHLRTLAEFTNYRRRVERAGRTPNAAGGRLVFLPLLDIVDDMEKAMRSAGDEDRHAMLGVQVVHQNILALLTSHGVSPFDSVGVTFNRDLHEPAETVVHEAGEPGTVVEELRRGYLWKAELLRPALVRVNGFHKEG